MSKSTTYFFYKYIRNFYKNRMRESVLVEVMDYRLRIMPHAIDCMVDLTTALCATDGVNENREARLALRG
jgi:hypothetical protein